ncbi:hypothetical protein CGRA01v4_02779 [Colletotrichum graminicola]|nr:hypothetical protein CGRA01v4_02779 [Colletotrichum graminicola]
MPKPPKHEVSFDTPAAHCTSERKPHPHLLCRALADLPLHCGFPPPVYVACPPDHGEP